MAKPPVVLVHGLWQHHSSWQPWVDLLAEHGYAAHAMPWPGDGATVEESRANPGPIAGVGIDAVVDHVASYAATLPEKPIVVGHSFGGLIAQKLLGQGKAAAAVALDPAQIKGVLPLPLVQLKHVLPILSNPANLNRAILLTKDQFAGGFASAIAREESDAIYDRYVVPSPAKPLFQAGLANFTPGSQAAVDVGADRGPLLITGGGKDDMVPEVVTRSAFKRYRKSGSVTDYHVFEDRGHTLCVDSGWREVADYVVEWLGAKGL